MKMSETACFTDGGDKGGAGELFACSAPRRFQAEAYRADFPALAQTVRGKPLAYLDNGASVQKPRMVLEAMRRFYERDYSNIHRGVHELSQRATAQYEAARERIGRFINSASSDEIVFTRGATESINLVANAWGNAFIKSGDEIVVTALEHHANIVPWQMLRERTGAVLRVIPVTPSGEVMPEEVAKAIGPRTRMVAVAHVSNVLGTILPVREIADMAHAAGALVLVDGCQAAGHMPVDVRATGADFYAFSGHKLYGPTGIGALYGRREVLSAMPPWQGGGDMITSVSFAKTTYMDPPYRFEAGTPPIAEAIGLAAAVEYVSTIGMDRIAAHENELLRMATERLGEISGLRVIGTAPRKAGALSFVMDGVHPHDIGTILDSEGVAVRAGHHCAQPLMDALGLVATARASFALYNTAQDVDALARAVIKARKMFQ